MKIYLHNKYKLKTCSRQKRIDNIFHISRSLPSHTYQSILRILSESCFSDTAEYRKMPWKILIDLRNYLILSNINFKAVNDNNFGKHCLTYAVVHVVFYLSKVLSMMEEL